MGEADSSLSPVSYLFIRSVDFSFYRLTFDFLSSSCSIFFSSAFLSFCVYDGFLRSEAFLTSYWLVAELVFYDYVTLYRLTLLIELRLLFCEFMPKVFFEFYYVWVVPRLLVFLLFGDVGLPTLASCARSTFSLATYFFQCRIMKRIAPFCKSC